MLNKPLIYVLHLFYFALYYYKKVSLGKIPDPKDRTKVDLKLIINTN